MKKPTKHKLHLFKKNTLMYLMAFNNKASSSISGSYACTCVLFAQMCNKAKSSMTMYKKNLTDGVNSQM